jgi:DNA polymerase (family 10)
MIRGDAAEQSLFTHAAAFVQARNIQSDLDVGSLIESPPADCDPEILRRLRQMYEAGGWVLVESAIADLPADLRWLYESGAVTIEQLGALHVGLGATSGTDLAAAVAEHRIKSLPGLDAAAEEAIAAALPGLRAHIPRIALGRAVAIVEPILEHLREVTGVAWALPAGSLRRGQDMVGDIEIVAAASDPSRAILELLHMAEQGRCLHQSARRVYLLVDRVQVGVRLEAPDNAGAALLYLTGAPAHFEALRRQATIAGWTLAASGLSAADGTPRPSATEEEIYSAIGLPVIPAEIRNGDEEVSRALAGTLPTLVAREHIRGDLHMHSTWSDGRDSIAAMADTCHGLGYEYIAITDHSPHSAASRNLTADGVRQQADEIGALREQYPGMTILHGCEVDILPDGRLDFPDKILENFDIVLASLHERAGHGPDQLLKRYTDAMRHPLVTLITHPTNRIVPHRAGYDLDWDRVFETAVSTATAVEIDGSPSHLDLDGALARRAIAAGCLMVINSDCHRVEMLDRQMRLGLTTARRGWVEPRHVLNTRSLAEVRAVIAAKRAAR